MAGKDPYRYFRVEAQELVEGLSQGILALERAEAPGELVHKLLRYAHTLKGAARVVKLKAMADRAHALEDLLSPLREGQAQVTREGIEAQLKLVDQVRAELGSLDAPAPGPVQAGPAPARPAAPPEPPARDAVRVRVAELDGLLESVSELSVRVRSFEGPVGGASGLLAEASLLVALLRRGAAPGPRLLAIAEGLQRGLARVEGQLKEASQRAERELAQVSEGAQALRLVEVSGLFGALERIARDAAQAVDREVALTFSGAEVRVETDVLARLQEALPHVVRNAVVHGIEPAAERRVLGKPAAGQVHLSVERRGGRVVLTCADDGRGIDRAAVLRSGVARGLLSPEQAARLSEAEADRLIFAPGLSTSAEVTELAGRGVGMDVVRTAVERLRGELTVRSTPGRGAAVTLDVPVALSSERVLRVVARDQEVGVPLDAVALALRVAEADLYQGGEPRVLHRGRLLPFFALSTLLGERAAPPRRAQWTALVLRGAGEEVAVGVDAILGTESVVVRPLPRLAGAQPAFAGASFDGEGSPRLVLDAAGFVRFALARRPDGPPAAVAARPPVLVIDDSLTTRMLEQSILESAGYDVDIAVSAEDGLEKARRRAYGLFVVDVDMPGMSGFDFVAHTRKDSALGKIPAIMVTSRSSEEDKRRGFAAGISAFVVKGEFDQVSLVSKIRELIG